MSVRRASPDSPSDGARDALPAAGPVAALDIGGTKMEAGVVAPDGTVLARRRAATEAADGSALLGLAVDLVRGAVADSGVAPAALGVGCGGPMDRGGSTVSPLNIPQWRGFPLAARLADATGLGVRVDNDAKALALGEGRFGAARGVGDYMAMVVSTGVGGGIVSDGRLLDGARANAGHIGHVVVEPHGRPCACGARGCLEAEVSGTAIALATGAPAAQADLAVRHRTGRLVGRVVAGVCNLLDLRLVVVAGSVALGYGDDFFGPAQAEVDRLARLEFSSGARIRRAECGADGPLLGAASLVMAPEPVSGGAPA